MDKTMIAAVRAYVAAVDSLLATRPLCLAPALDRPKAARLNAARLNYAAARSVLLAHLERAEARPGQPPTGKQRILLRHIAAWGEIGPGAEDTIGLTGAAFWSVADALRTKGYVTEGYRPTELGALVAKLEETS